MLESHIGELVARMAANKKMADSFRIPRPEMAKPRILTEIVGDEVQYIRGKVTAYSDVSPNLRWRCIVRLALRLLCVRLAIIR